MGDVVFVGYPVAQETPSPESVVAEYVGGLMRFKHLDPLTVTGKLPLKLATTVLRRYACAEMVVGEVCPDCTYPVAPEDAVPSGDRFHHAECLLECNGPQSDEENARTQRIRYLFQSTADDGGSV